LLINIICGALTFWLITKLIYRWYEEHKTEAFILSLFFLSATNLLGIIFTGMEHSLQVLLSTAAFYGAIIKNQLPLTIWVG